MLYVMEALLLTIALQTAGNMKYRNASFLLLSFCPSSFFVFSTDSERVRSKEVY